MPQGTFTLHTAHKDPIPEPDHIPTIYMSEIARIDNILSSVRYSKPTNVSIPTSGDQGQTTSSSPSRNLSIVPQHQKKSVKVPDYIQIHFELIQSFRFSPDPAPGSRCHNIAFWLLTILALTQSLQSLKYMFYHYEGYSGVERQVTLLYFLNKLIIRIWFIKITWRNGANLKTLFQALEHLDLGTPTTTRLMKRKVVYGVGFLSAGLIVADCIQGIYTIEEWTIMNTLWDKTDDFLQFFYIWTGQDNSTIYVKSIDESVSTTGAIFFGASQFIIEVVGKTLHYFIRNMFLFLAITIYGASQDFYSYYNGQVTCSDVWSKYKHLRYVTEIIDDLFGNLLKFLHLENVLFVMYTLLRWLGSFEYNFAFLLLTICTSTAMCLSYFSCIRGSILMSKFRIWIHENSNECDKKLSVCKNWKISVLLDDFSNNPVGIGTRSFYIDESFVEKLIGIILTYFIIFAELVETKKH